MIKARGTFLRTEKKINLTVRLEAEKQTRLTIASGGDE